MYSVCIYRRPDNSLAVGFNTTKQYKESTRIVANYADNHGYGGVFKTVDARDIKGNILVSENIAPTFFGA